MHTPDPDLASEDTLRATLQGALAPGYEIVRELGGGGMSRVFVARDLALERDVVVKALPDVMIEGLSRDRFRREVLLSATLQHPNIVGVISAGDANGVPFFIMPMVDGESLRALLAREGRLTIPGAVMILRDVARALAYAHGRGVVHRDIKPDNILLSGGAAVVADFGVAKALVSAREPAQDAPQTLTRVGMSLGTPTYMAPEQVVADPNADQRMDLYSLGVMAFEMLTGSPPFVSSNLSDLMTAHLTRVPEPLAVVRPGVPAALHTLVMACLEKDPARRPQSAGELLQRLDDPAVISGAVPSLASLPSVTPPAGNVLLSPASGAVEPHAHPAPARRLLRYGAAAAAAIAVAAAVWWGTRARDAGAPATVPPAVAVLPMELVSSDSADAYLAQGLTDELMTALARIDGVKVASRLAARSLAGAAGDPAAAARGLGITMTLEGTVQRRGDRLRITARLVNAADGFATWSDTYERPVEELYAVQGEITNAVASVVRAGMASGDASSSLGRVRGETRDAQAYDEFLRGHYMLQRRGGATLRAAAAHFERAIARDPGFARAHAELAQTYAVLPLYTSGENRELRAAAEGAAVAALQLDSTLAVAHAALGYLQNGAWEWERARASLERAVALDSTDASAMQWLGENLLVSGDARRAADVLATAARLGDESPVIAGLHAVALGASGDLDAAVTAARRAVEGDPALAVTRYMFGTVLIYAQRYADAIVELEEARRLAPAILPVTGALGHAYVKNGRTTDATRLLAELQRAPERPGAQPAIAKIRIATGDVAGALAALHRAADGHDDFFAAEPMGTPLFAPLHGTPGFRELVAKVGFTGGALETLR